MRPRRSSWRRQLALPAGDVALAVLEPLLARLAEAREPALGDRESHPPALARLDPELDQGPTCRIAGPATGRRCTTSAATHGHEPELAVRRMREHRGVALLRTSGSGSTAPSLIHQPGRVTRAHTRSARHRSRCCGRSGPADRGRWRRGSRWLPSSMCATQTLHVRDPNATVELQCVDGPPEVAKNSGNLRVFCRHGLAVSRVSSHRGGKIMSSSPRVVTLVVRARVPRPSSGCRRAPRRRPPWRRSSPPARAASRAPGLRSAS